LTLYVNIDTPTAGHVMNVTVLIVCTVLSCADVSGEFSDIYAKDQEKQ